MTMEQYCQRALDKDGFVVIGTEFQRAIGEVVEERMASKFGVISAKIVVIAPSTFRGSRFTVQVYMWRTSST